MQLMLPRHILPSLHVSVSHTVWLDFLPIIEITSGVSVFHTYRSLNEYKHSAPCLKSLRVHVFARKCFTHHQEWDGQRGAADFGAAALPLCNCWSHLWGFLVVCWPAMLPKVNRFVKTDTQHSGLPLLQWLRMHARKKWMPFLLFICVLHRNAIRGP